MRFAIYICVPMFVAASVFAADNDGNRGVETVNKSIAWLEADMKKWRSAHGCAACHHGPMYLWSMNVARRQGYAVDHEQLQEMTRWLLTNDDSRIFPKAAGQSGTSDSTADRMTSAMMGHNNLSQPTLYLAHALNVIPDDDPLKQMGWQQVVDHLAQAQKGDGSFEGRNAWRPIFNTPQILTRFAATAMREASQTKFPETIAGKQRVVLEKAESFLSLQPADDTQQGLVLRLLSARDLDSTLVMQLTKLQRANGGWAQTDERDSDAFATGQALYALHRAGVPATEPVIRKGLDYLIKAQRDDGTWPMTSRTNPETGLPATFLNPISYAATAWATLGLTSHVPKTIR